MESLVKKLSITKENILFFSNIIKKNKPVWDGIKPSNLSKDSFLHQELPNIDRHRPDSNYLDLRNSDDRGLSQWTSRRLSVFAEENKYASNTNAIVYNPMSFMDWHTNSDNVGYRHYFTFTNKEAIFRWIDPFTKTVYDDLDNVGWTYRVFKISKETPVWHTIWSEGIRFSFGFNSTSI